MPSITLFPIRTRVAHARKSTITSRALALEDSAAMGVHLTFLRPDGNDKAGGVEDAKLTGCKGSTGSPICLAPPNDLLGFSVTEGIEDALSIHEATGLGVWAWAAGTAGRMPALGPRRPRLSRHCDRGRRRGSVWAQRLRRRRLRVEMLVLSMEQGAVGIGASSIRPTWRRPLAILISTSISMGPPESRRSRPISSRTVRRTCVRGAWCAYTLSPGGRYLIEEALFSAASVSSTVSRTVVWTELSAPPAPIASAVAAIETLSGASHKVYPSWSPKAYQKPCNFPPTPSMYSLAATRRSSGCSMSFAHVAGV